MYTGVLEQEYRKVGININSLLLDTIQFVRLTLMMFYYCKQTNQYTFSNIMNSNDLDKQLFEYIKLNENTMFDSEYDICRTVEMMVMGKNNEVK